MNWATISERGDREINEDSLGVFHNGDRHIFMVADGLGGHGRGDTASSLAVKAFKETLAENAEPLPLLMSSAFLKAQASILAEQKRSGCFFQMKTTACALAVDRGHAMWSHIGDSRVYAFSHNRIKKRTLDHSVPQMLVLTREIREKDIREHPDRNKLLRVLGVLGDTPGFELSELQELRKFQAFLLCSDGFWEYILEKEMCALLKKSSSVEEWLQLMRETVEERGKGKEMDNYSAVAIWT